MKKIKLILLQVLESFLLALLSNFLVNKTIPQNQKRGQQLLIKVLANPLLLVRLIQAMKKGGVS